MLEKQSISPAPVGITKSLSPKGLRASKCCQFEIENRKTYCLKYLFGLLAGGETSGFTNASLHSPASEKILNITTDIDPQLVYQDTCAVQLALINEACYAHNMTENQGKPYFFVMIH